MSRAQTLPDVVTRDLDRRVRGAQRTWRVPGLSVGVVRDGSVVFRSHVGSARLDPPTTATDASQFAIGSVTKTFIALAVMRLRDEQRLTLADPLFTHLPASRHGHLVLRDLLSHTSGLQREPVGRIWQTLDSPDAEQLFAGLDGAEAVLDPHTAWHYSNLAYALLGQVVEKVTGRSWEAVVRDQVLTPLGMNDTSLVPTRPVTGYYVHPHRGTARVEPTPDLRAFAPAGGLWSTLPDLSRYAAFLAAPDPAVIAEPTLEAMTRPVVIRDDTWSEGHGLGFQLGRVGDRILIGHSGGVPGFVTGLRVHRESGVGAVVLTNASSGSAPMGLAAELITTVLDADPVPEDAWVPEQERPDLDGVLGPWWMEGSQLVFEVREGELCSHFAGAPAVSGRYAPDGVDRWRIVEGYERGELLEVDRDAAGQVTRMHLATYALTGAPSAFADLRGSSGAGS